MAAKRFIHTLIAVALLACIICPFVELSVHSDGSIFTSGHDTESSIALFLLVVELSIAVGPVLTLFLPRATAIVGISHCAEVTLK